MSKPTLSPEKMQLARNLFRQHDKDKSGYLDIEEMWQAINELMIIINYNYKCTKEEITALVKIVDKNGDYRLSLKEFM